MASYTIIRDIGNELISRLKAELPLYISIRRDEIGLAKDINNLDYRLNLYLYDIAKLDAAPYQQQYNNPLTLALKYMIIANSSQTQAADEYLVLGKVMQYFHENPVIQANSEILGQNQPSIYVNLESLNLDENIRIRSNLKGMPLALFYQLSPVIIEAEKNPVFVRVVEIGE